MKKIALIAVLIYAQLHAYSDADWDGVEDRYDQCPQTPLSDLVDLNGCTTLKTQASIHYSIISGIGYSKINYASQERADTTNLSLEANLYFDRWQLQGSVSRYTSTTENSNESGMEDSVVNLFYRWTFSERLSVTPGIGVIFPTYTTLYANEATDYSMMLGAEYQFSPTLYGFGGYGYTWVNDTDTPIASYQNSASWSAGLSYTVNGDQERNICYNANDTIGWFSQLTPHWFVEGNYDYGLSDSAGEHSWNVRAGYYF
jgi:hypothetical protein